MKKFVNLKLITLMIFAIILFASPLITNTPNSTMGIIYKNSVSDDLNNKGLKLLKVSGKIHIDGNSGWAAFKVAGNCTGNGTYSNPYVIEDLEINGGGSGSCIIIENSDVFFRIENCTVYNSGVDWGDGGIKLYNVDNGQIINNYANNNDFIGIILEYSQNISISGNIANSNIEYGIGLWYSHNNIISENTFKYNGWGLSLESSNNNGITGNNANENINDGIGIWNSINNLVSENDVFANAYRGIFLYNGDSNNISGNIVVNNGDYGIRLEYNSNNNIFTNNSFINNNQNAIDYGTDNQWDNGSTGNYWSDYSGVDANDDGIGDTPYDIAGTAGSYDYFPIWFDPPVFSVNSPYQNQCFSLNSPTYSISILEGLVNSTWYTLDGGIDHIFTGLTGIIDEAFWNSSTDGPITIRFYANDTMGLISSNVITVIKDTTAPIIMINSPSTDEIFGNKPPEYNLTIIEPNINRMWYTLDGGATNFTFTEFVDTIDQTLWNSIPEENVTIRFYVEDYVGYITFEEIRVIKSVPPRIPGYNLIFLLGILSVVLILLNKKIMKT
ncbi:MAG: NosD domain-containing protein [Candidatus Hodarchaeota archaeon]